MTTTIINTATARTTLGSWPLLIAANIIGYPSGQVLGPANQQLFTVLVVPYTPPTTTSQTAITMTPTTVETATSAATTSQQPVSSTQTTMFTSTQNTQNNSTYYLAIACIGLIIVVFAMLIRQRGKKQARRERTRVY
jgi:carbohydrate-binding DOMON domain-containing protein